MNSNINVEDHLPLVQHIVTRMSANFPRSVSRDDVVQAGMLGLVEAAQRYNSEKGATFAHFAGTRIEGSILDFVKADNWMPRRLRGTQKQINRAAEELSNAGKTASDTAIGATLGMSAREVNTAKAKINQSVVTSLDISTPSIGSIQAGARGKKQLPDNCASALDKLISSEEQRYLRAAISLLPERQKFVIESYFLREHSLDQIAAALGVGKTRASRLKSAALEKLHDGLSGQFKEPKQPKTNRQRNAAEFAADVAELAAAGA